MAFKKGPYLELVRNPKDAVGVKVCGNGCGRTREVRINRNGWPYSYCYGEMGCGASETPRGEIPATALIEQITQFRPRFKRKTLEVAGLKKSKDATTPSDGDEGGDVSLIDPPDGSEKSAPPQSDSPPSRGDDVAIIDETKAAPRDKSKQKNITFTIFGKPLS